MSVSVHVGPALEVKLILKTHVFQLVTCEVVMARNANTTRRQTGEGGEEDTETGSAEDRQKDKETRSSGVLSVLKANQSNPEKWKPPEILAESQVP